MMMILIVVRHTLHSQQRFACNILWRCRRRQLQPTKWRFRRQCGGFCFCHRHLLLSSVCVCCCCFHPFHFQARPAPSNVIARRMVHTSHVTRHTSHVTSPRSGFRAPATGGGKRHAAAAASAWTRHQQNLSQLPRIFLSREHSLAQACACGQGLQLRAYILAGESSYRASASQLRPHGGS